MIKKIIAIMIATVLLAAVFAGCTKQNTGSKVLATVGTQKITAKNLNVAIKKYAIGQKVTPKLKEEMLTNLVKVKLLEYMGTQDQLTSSKTYKKEFAQAAKEALAETGYKHFIVNQIKITPKEYQILYKKDMKKFIKPASATVYQIVVKTKKQANLIFAKLKSGVSFATLAKKYSINKYSAKNGGKIGTYTKSTTIGQYKKAIFSMTTPGVYPHALLIKGKYSILKVANIKTKHQMTLKEAKPQLKTEITRTKTLTSLKSWRKSALKKYGKLNAANFKKAINNTLKGNKEIIATIGKETVTLATINKTLSKLPSYYRSEFTKSIKMRTLLVNNVILQKLLVYAAKKNGLKASVEFKKTMKVHSNNILTQLAYKNFILNKVKITPKQSKTFYNKHKSEIRESYKKAQPRIVEMLKRQGATKLFIKWYKTNKTKYVKIKVNFLPKTKKIVKKITAKKLTKKAITATKKTTKK